MAYKFSRYRSLINKTAYSAENFSDIGEPMKLIKSFQGLSFLALILGNQVNLALQVNFELFHNFYVVHDQICFG